MKKILTIPLLLFCFVVSGQQSQQLYQMHYLGESNFLNPAVQSECKWFIGIPALSSIHLNIANSAASYRQIIDNTSDSTANLQIDKVINRLGWRTTLATELQITLLALGYKYEDYYFAFSIIEKNDFPLTLSKDIFSLAWKGNTQFEGEKAGTRGTALYATHYREYALGVSRQTSYTTFYGIKGKLLFGKYNASTPKFDVSLYTDPQTFDLTVASEMKANISAPILIDAVDGQASSLEFSLDESVSPMQFIFNRKNWGVAFDAGFIHQYNDKVRLSGSILDLGFIRWKSNVNNLEADEEFTYQGVLVDTGLIRESIMDSINVTLTQNSYTTMLPTKIYFGVEYAITERLAANGLTSAVIYRTKFAPKLTLGLDYNPFGNFHLVTSYSVMYRSFKNLGFGFSMGRGPVQFYAITDNVAGMIWPLSTRNINLRFGLNINLGCQQKEKVPNSVQRSSVCGYDCYAKPWERQKRRRKR